MILDRNSSGSSKKNGSSPWTYFVFFICVIAIVFLGAKERIRTELRNFISVTNSAPSYSKEEIENIVQDYIKANPQLIIASVQDMQKREFEESMKKSKEAVIKKKDEIQGKESDIQLVAGNKDGDVTVVAFLDYRCGYCRKVNTEIKELIKKDPKVRVLFKEYPVLGEASLRIAKTALAVYLYDPTKYLDFHNAVMSSNDPNDKFILNTLKLLNLDTAKIDQLIGDPRISNEIAAVAMLSQEIGVRGTPAFIIGDELIPGAVDANTMLNLVQKAREAKKEKK